MLQSNVIPVRSVLESARLIDCDLADWCNISLVGRHAVMQNASQRLAKCQSTSIGGRPAAMLEILMSRVVHLPRVQLTL